MGNAKGLTVLTSYIMNIYMNIEYHNFLPRGHLLCVRDGHEKNKCRNAYPYRNVECNVYGMCMVCMSQLLNVNTKYIMTHESCYTINH